MKKLFGILLSVVLVFTLSFVMVGCSDNTVDVWDGSDVATSEEMDAIYNQDTSTYEITEVSQLKWLADKVNNENVSFAGKTIRLMKNLDLNSQPWNAIGNVETYPSKTFSGTFDGNGFAILNLNVTDKDSGSEYATAGLFGSVKDATIKDLTITNATITSDHYAGVLVGYISDGTLTIENCNVVNATVISTPVFLGTKYDNGDKVGGLVGYATNLTVTGTTLSEVSVTGYRHIGGIVGYVSVYNINGNTLEDMQLVQDDTNGYKDPAVVELLIGKIAGNFTDVDVFGENTFENVTITNVDVQ